jgi:Cft2 family RNA processing exonuclease
VQREQLPAPCTFFTSMGKIFFSTVVCFKANVRKRLKRISTFHLIPQELTHSSYRTPTSFSAHADRNELLAYFNQFDRNRLKKVFLVHGDLDQAEKFFGGLKEQGFKNVAIPVHLEKFEI